MYNEMFFVIVKDRPHAECEVVPEALISMQCIFNTFYYSTRQPAVTLRRLPLLMLLAAQTQRRINKVCSPSWITVIHQMKSERQADEKTGAAV